VESFGREDVCEGERAMGREGREETMVAVGKGYGI